MKKRILLTGGAGFIGHHTVEHFLINTDWDIVVIDSLNYAGDVGKIYNSDTVKQNLDRLFVFWHDLNAPIMETLKNRIGKIDYIINMASESHVDRSLSDPVPFVMNNVRSTLTMLEFTREIKPDIFVQISTDEVYGATKKGDTFKEWSTILPSNPYSASKAAQEAIAISYWRSYNVPLIITNTMNNFGERQNREKFVPKTIQSILDNTEVPIHGIPGNIGSRAYLHARNHADALLFILNLGIPPKFPEADRPERYNIVGERVLTNLEMAELIAQQCNKPLKYKLIDFHSTRPGHDPHYGLNGNKLKSLGWKAPLSLEQSLLKTIQWTIKNPGW